MSVPTKSFGELLTSVARRLQVLNDDGGIGGEGAGDLSGDLTDLANSAMRAAWTFFAWPDALEIGEEDVISHPDVAGARYVPKQTSERTLSSVLRVWDRDPRQGQEAPQLVPHKVFPDGVYIYTPNQATVWVHYRPAAPEYTDAVWNAGTTYAARALVLATDGHVYRSLQGANVNKSPLTEGDWWGQVPVLECLFEPVKQGVISHYKRYQSGQPVSAKTFDVLMQDDLEREIQTIRDQEN